MTAAVAIVALAAVLAGSSPAAPPPPQLAATAAGVTLRVLPPILAADTVREELTSGLTNTFVITLEAHAAQGRSVRGGATVEIRYDLWDETWLVAAGGLDGVRREQTLASFDDLQQWWQSLELAVLPALDAHAGSSWRTTVELSLLPFSQAEQRDAEVWFSRSLGPAARPDGGDGAAAGSAAADSARSGALNLLVATSLQRAAVLALRWRIDLELEPADADDD